MMELFLAGCSVATGVWGVIIALIVKNNRRKFSLLADAFKAEAKEKADSVLKGH